MRQNKYGFWKGFIPVVAAGAIILGLSRNTCEEDSNLVKKLEVPEHAQKQEIQTQAKPQEASRTIVHDKTYAGFRYPKELPTIIYTADRIGVEPELLMAIRMSENGRPGLEFGIIPTEAYKKSKGYTRNDVVVSYRNELEKQASWSACTIKKNKERFEKEDKSKYQDFIDFLGDKYAPIGVDNDPKGLNANWESNVRANYNQFKSGGKK